MSMSKTFIGGAVCREFESEAPAVEEMLVYAAANSSVFRCALNVVMVVELLVDEDGEFQTVGVHVPLLAFWLPFLTNLNSVES